MICVFKSGQLLKPSAPNSNTQPEGQPQMNAIQTAQTGLKLSACSSASVRLALRERGSSPPPALALLASHATLMRIIALRAAVDRARAACTACTAWRLFPLLPVPSALGDGGGRRRWRRAGICCLAGIPTPMPMATATATSVRLLPVAAILSINIAGIIVDIAA